MLFVVYKYVMTIVVFGVAEFFEKYRDSSLFDVVVILFKA